MWPAWVKAGIIRWQPTWPSNSWFQLNISLYAYTRTPSSQDWPNGNSWKTTDSCLKNYQSCDKFAHDFLWISIQFSLFHVPYLPGAISYIQIFLFSPFCLCACAHAVFMCVCIFVWNLWQLISAQVFYHKNICKNYTQHIYSLSLILSHTPWAKSQRKKEESKKQLNQDALLK